MLCIRRYIYVIFQEFKHNQKKGIVVTDSPILTVEASYRTEISHIANAIEMDCQEHLLAPPKGIYCSGKLEPAMIDGQTYYSSKSGSRLEPITDINKVNTAVYNESGKCVIPLLYMKKRNLMVSNEPFMSYRGLHIVRELVTNQIDHSCAYRRYAKDKHGCISKHFIPGTDINEIYADVLDVIYKPLEAEIYEFLGNHAWDMHFAKLQNTILIIERGMDYRAYCWEQEHGDAWRAGKYNASA